MSLSLFYTPYASAFHVFFLPLFCFSLFFVLKIGAVSDSSPCHFTTMPSYYCFVSLLKIINYSQPPSPRETKRRRKPIAWRRTWEEEAMEKKWDANT
ncbi:unnamed protein product [Ilex paraguariensis]|uniref:Uncharacterized protein n=1 Tax=Ilex paraguariensis TaxID=185542 RepID=A0ABC8RLU0_9AQUA